MNTDIKQAFDHPTARSEAMAEGAPRDRISLRDHLVDVEIGAFQSERGVRQRLRFNIVVEVNTHAADAADDVDRILSYDCLTDAIAIELAAERLNLLETLAERVADRILTAPQAERVFVRIEKLDRGPGALGVEIVRDGGAQFPATPMGAREIPRVITVDLAQMTPDALREHLDHVAQAGRACVLCAAPLEAAGPRAAHPMAQRRIDLLALDQWAWVLAGMDPRCVVVGSRTELDWASAQGKLSVWAPSKMVIDAVDGPDGHEFAHIVAWFCAQIEAEDTAAWPT